MRPPYENLQLQRMSPADAQRSCLDKVRHDSRTTARDASARKSKGAAEPLTVYRCTVCGGFHLTRVPKASRPAVENALRKRAGT